MHDIYSPALCNVVAQIVLRLSRALQVPVGPHGPHKVYDSVCMPRCKHDLSLSISAAILLLLWMLGWQVGGQCVVHEVVHAFMREVVHAWFMS